MNPRLWMRVFFPLRRTRTKEERKAFAERMRREAFDTPITDEQRAADRQLLADAVAKKGSLI